MKYNQKQSLVYFGIILVLLLLVFASRVQFLTDVPLNQDEARSGMRSMGTIDEIIAWQPPDWPPLHNILLGGWANIAGEFPFSLRVFSAFFSIISVCFAYRMAYYLTADKRIAWGTFVLYAALGMSIHLGVFIRGYAITIALFPLAIWLTARYFDHHRKLDMLWLALILGWMFITSYTAVTAFVFLGLFTILKYPRQIWRWIPVGVLASPFLAIELFRKSTYWLNRFSSNNPTTVVNYDIVLVYQEHFQHYIGQIAPFWILLILASLALTFWFGRQHLRVMLWVVIACVLAPFTTFLFVKSGVFNLMSPRYTWWVLIVLALGISIGLRYLPTVIWLGVMTILLGTMFTLRFDNLYYTEEPTTYYYESNMAWLSQHMETGDSLLFDPNFCIKKCFDQDVLAYFWGVYLQDNVIRINQIGDQRRIWLWRGVGHSRELLDELSATHVPSIFYGPPISLLELYDAPPDPEGIPFENGMRFHGFDIIYKDGHLDLPPYDLREKSSMRIRLWWSADRLIDGDYQVSIQIHDTLKHNLVAQNDNAPQLIHLKPNAFEPLPAQTSEWEPSKYYVEERSVDLSKLNTEVYTDLFLVVYRLSDGQRMTADGVTDDNLFPLTNTIVWGWG